MSQLNTVQIMQGGAAVCVVSQSSAGARARSEGSQAASDDSGTASGNSSGHMT